MMDLPIRRAAIVGTAPSWMQTPWSDPGLYIAGLNDGYMCRDAYGRGPQRASEWWELHPLDQMYFRAANSTIVMADQIPPGHYVRPAGHLEWLKAQAKTIPVWLQADPPPGWPPLARRLNVEDLEAQYGTYWASGPAYMLLSLLSRGCEELHVYGIHLSTEHEYR